MNVHTCTNGPRLYRYAAAFKKEMKILNSFSVKNLAKFHGSAYPYPTRRRWMQTISLGIMFLWGRVALLFCDFTLAHAATAVGWFVSSCVRCFRCAVWLL